MPRQKQSDYVTALENFWWQVHSAEIEVRQNSHQGRLPPECASDPWDQRFADSYEALRPFLGKIRQERMFRVPVGLQFFTGPMKAESGHQALMYFLNPPAELYGELSALDSREYQAIKRLAQDECDQIQAKRLKKQCETPLPFKAKLFGELIRLRCYLREYHFLEKAPNYNPLTQKELTKKFNAKNPDMNWSPPTMSRRMAKLFSDPDGMKAYAKVFTRGLPPSGYRRRFEDGTLDVEGKLFDKAIADDLGDA